MKIQKKKIVASEYKRNNLRFDLILNTFIEYLTFDLHWKLNDWFLYKMQDWALIVLT